MRQMKSYMTGFQLRHLWLGLCKICKICKIQCEECCLARVVCKWFQIVFHETTADMLRCVFSSSVHVKQSSGLELSDACQTLHIVWAASASGCFRTKYFFQSLKRQDEWENNEWGACVPVFFNGFHCFSWFCIAFSRTFIVFYCLCF